MITNVKIVDENHKAIIIDGDDDNPFVYEVKNSIDFIVDDLKKMGKIITIKDSKYLRFLW